MTKRIRCQANQKKPGKALSYSVTVLKLLLFYSALEFNLVIGYKRMNPADEAKQSVCYEHLGCFASLPPFSPKMPLPVSPKQVATKYFLRTRQNPREDEPISPDADNITRSSFDPTRPTKIIIHGFVMTNPQLAKWVPEVAETILYQEDVNVIMIDWVKGAAMEYDNAASNTRLVGSQVAHLINMLMEVKSAKSEDFHLIGFSLGAHVAGFAGKRVQEGAKKNMVGRITGLDPANPWFNYDSPKVRLDRSDAKFVDVIHTDTSTVLVMASGLNRNLGHIDFFPNGGADQTGCNSWNKDATWIETVTDSTVCDHLRAPQLFKASINATGEESHMAAYQCDNYEKFKRGVCLRCQGKRGLNKGGNRCRRMGYWATPPRGKKNQLYYLITSGEAPFTVKHYQVQIHWRNHTKASAEGFKAKLFLTLHGTKGSSPEFALNDGSTFHVVAGRTTRFLVTQDTTRDIGQIERVTFRWERPTCWTYFFCPKENVHLKRIKIFDAQKQERSVFLPIGRKQRIKRQEVLPKQPFELLHTTYIKSNFPKRYKTLDREVAALKRSENAIVPPLVPVYDEKSIPLNPRKRAADHSLRSSPLSALLRNHLPPV